MSTNINIHKEYYRIKSESHKPFTLEFNLSISIRDDMGWTGKSATYRLYRNNTFVYEVHKNNFDGAQWKAYFVLSLPGSYHFTLTYYIYIRKGFWPFYFGSYSEKKEVRTVNFPFMTESLDEFILEC